MRIVGPHSGDPTTILGNLLPLGAHTRFVNEMFWPLWNAAIRYNLDPVVVVAQSFHETGGGNYGGKVPAWFHNTAGLKVADLNAQMALIGTTDGDHPLCHAQFATWEAGAAAQCQHLRAYAGWPFVGSTIVDPRYSLVTGQWCENVEDLSGKWAPSPTYGAEVVDLAHRLRGVA